MLYNVWVPTGEMECFEVEAESASEAKIKWLDRPQDYEVKDYFYGDISSADIEVEEAF